MPQTRHSKSAEIRSRLDHPVIDADGHVVELTPLLLDYIGDAGGGGMVDRFLKRDSSPYFRMSPEERRDTWTPTPAWWAFSAENTLDRATVSLPALLYERMDEMGLDFSILYPSIGLGMMRLRDHELRQVVCRAYNAYQADLYREYSDRLTPAAVIPMNTPQEGIDALEHAVVDLGLKAAVVPGHIIRPIPKYHREYPELDQVIDRLDTLGIDSEYDYDPVWAKFVELKVAVTSHSGTQGWGTRRSISRYMYNQAGHFGEGGDIFARSLFMGGVTRRFPTLNFAFLEGGVGWACTLYAGMIGRWEKRNGEVVGRLDPAKADMAMVERLISQYGNDRIKAMRGQIEESFLGFQQAAPEVLDDWSACKIERSEEIRDLFTESFYFGCEADDPLNAWAFDTRVNPHKARLKAMFGSDVGHWDVPDMGRVLEEAYELVERGLLSTGDFRDFVFTNPASLHTRLNRDFFKGTRVESAVEAG
jgi:predicted TIM-barrel fold metal-dependent hydrolase